MKESYLRKKAKDELRDWVYWFPSRTKWHSNDIMTIMDGVAWNKKGEELYIQITTYSNMRAREKKIRKFFKENNLDIKKFPFRVEVWGWKAHKPLKKIKIK